ncbi:putative Glycosyl transferase CAP10 domain-containing protein [Seiridium cardinale]
MVTLGRAWLKYLALGVILTVLLSYVTLYQQPDGLSRLVPARPEWLKGGLGSVVTGGEKQDGPSPPKTTDNHPISELIAGARTQLSQLLGKRSLSLEQAANRYRERRGRHPPPGFEKWFEAAKSSDAIIVEEFFDRIHHDINPFWALDPLELRRQTHLQPQVIRVRDGKADFETDNPHRPEWIQLWTQLVQDMMPHLPDLDMVINVMDETRVLVPWENITDHVAVEQKSRKLFPVDDATSEYTDYSELDNDKEQQVYDPKWIGGKANQYWDFLASACPPGSPARKFKSLETFNESIIEVFPTRPLSSYTYDGFVQNFTAAQDPCQQPHLRGLHGTFVESVSMSTSTKLFPIFTGSKLPQNNDLLIPGGMYLTEREFYSGGDDHGGLWSEKKNELIWRGVASGGRHKEDNWWHFQRHRFVQMMNGTTVAQVEHGETEAAPTFNLLPASTYNVAARKKDGLGAWLDTFSDVGFVRMDCFPDVFDEEGHKLDNCPHMDPYMALVQPRPMKEMFDYKFIPDVDGNSYSARWRGFLLSSSCPLKATIYTEWHDDRLVPWQHFVPFDNTYMDIYAIMDYFLDGHDAEAQRIAEESREWADKVLRREDMMLYVWRLLLEYARVLDPKRDRLGFVADLTGRP